MKKFKMLVSALLAAALTASLCGCGGGTSTASSQSNAASGSSTTSEASAESSVFKFIVHCTVPPKTARTSAERLKQLRRRLFGFYGWSLCFESVFTGEA